MLKACSPAQALQRPAGAPAARVPLLPVNMQTVPAGGSTTALLACFWTLRGKQLTEQAGKGVCACACLFSRQNRDPRLCPVSLLQHDTERAQLWQQSHRSSNVNPLCDLEEVISLFEPRCPHFSGAWIFDVRLFGLTPFSSC